MEKYILITGGSGYIGSAIIDALKDRFQIINLDNSPPREEWQKNVSHIFFDITSEESLDNALSDVLKRTQGRIHSVIHLAGYYNFDGQENPLYEKVNVTGTRLLLTHLKESFKVGQFIFASSMLVYAPSRPGIKITEDSSLDQGWAYPRSKVQCENIIRDLHGDIPIVILRVAAVYNDYGHAPAIANQVLRIHEIHPTSFLFPGNPEHRQSAIHVEDLAEAMSLIVDKKDELPLEVTLSLAEDKTPDYLTIHRILSKLDHRHAFPLLPFPRALAKLGAHLLPYLPSARKSFIRPWMIRYSDANYDLDNTAIKKLLSWSPRHDLESTLPLIVEHIKKNPGGWYEENKIPPPKITSVLRTHIFKKIGEAI